VFAIVNEELFINIALASAIKIIRDVEITTLVAVYPTSGDVILGVFNEYEKAKKQRENMFLSFEAGCIAYKIQTS
jgi:hypothetical protein